MEPWRKVTVENGLSEEEFNDSCIISLKPVLIAFDENMPNNFKPEMPFKTKLSVTTPDGGPANDVQISLKIEFVNSTPPLILNTVSKNGMAIFDIPGTIFILLTGQSVRSESDRPTFWLSVSVLRNVVETSKSLTILKSSESRA